MAARGVEPSKAVTTIPEIARTFLVLSRAKAARTAGAQHPGAPRQICSMAIPAFSGCSGRSAQGRIRPPCVARAPAHTPARSGYHLKKQFLEKDGGSWNSPSPSLDLSVLGLHRGHARRAGTHDSGRHLPDRT